MENAAHFKENILSKSQKQKDPKNFVKLRDLTEIENFGKTKSFIKPRLNEIKIPHQKV